MSAHLQLPDLWGQEEELQELRRQDAEEQVLRLGISRQRFEQRLIVILVVI